MSDEQTRFKDRPARRRAYFHIEVSRFKRLPLFKADVGLMDISLEGLKVQFHKNIEAKPKDRFWVTIPMSTIDEQKADLSIEAEVVWFQKEDLMMGAHFLEVTEEQKEIISALTEQLRKAGKLAC